MCLTHLLTVDWGQAWAFEGWDRPGDRRIGLVDCLCGRLFGQERLHVLPSTGGKMLYSFPHLPLQHLPFCLWCNILSAFGDVTSYYRQDIPAFLLPHSLQWYPWTPLRFTTVVDEALVWLNDIPVSPWPEDMRRRRRASDELLHFSSDTVHSDEEKLHILSKSILPFPRCRWHSGLFFGQRHGNFASFKRSMDCRGSSVWLYVPR